jgi:hypothetical protein
MSKKSDDAAYCKQRAEEDRWLAEREPDPKLKKAYLDLRDRWTKLANCYERPDSVEALRALIGE